MKESTDDLRALGWGPAFQSQLELEELETMAPVRVAAVHRDAVDLLGAEGALRAECAPGLSTADLAVGDWGLVGQTDGRFHRRLERASLLSRRAAGEGRAEQLIAANVDTLFIVSSCNADFNPARIERYLVLARQSGAMPVLVLTKADGAEDASDYARRAAALDPMLPVETLDARDVAQTERLLDWFGVGRTAALLGSSGVGKSTLINALTGAGQATRGIREDDAKGRHTTTSRSLHAIPSGGWLIDTPGMRALRLHDAAEGVAAVFADIAALASGCRYGDCAHEAEPGCAVQASIAAGDLDPARLARWRKLEREEAHNSASVAEARARARALGRLHRSGKSAGRRKRGE
jgi:ribosome biogenesis GTPase